ncbi:MAG: TonB-dependent receptor plug domain-containing protein [Muribaculaceae bacterium]|nr:TonB-dependent receptor plug domain-containing protein [Muribaculaceae bacterium]
MAKLLFRALLLSVITAGANGDMSAHNPDSLANEPIRLRDVNVVRRINHLSEISKVDLAANPVKSSQEILRSVPGLFIAQHAGGGKAEQMFLRGFDLDHGTDINISVDGMPVNMVSHAHGQGYADLHFLQPEVIENIDFDKGLYDMTKGDLATAGYVAFKTRDRMPSQVSAEIGMHDYQRYRASMSLIDRENESFYFAGAFLSDNGYFDSPQHFKRLNAMAKYTRWGENSRFNIIASHFNSSWNASGQIPERAVDNGMIGWFGSLDASEGGSTSRSNLQFLHKIYLPDGATVSSDFYLSYYTFNLFSDFTFQLNDPEHWDEINQKEKRVIAGGHTDYNDHFHVGDETWKWSAGAGFRYDHIMDIALYHTENRHQLGTYSLGDIDESNMFGFAGLEMNLGPVMINPSVRVDWFHFNYADKTAEVYDDKGTAQAFVSPKLNITYNPARNLQLYLKGGRGFHSNDARVVVVENGRNVLPQALGADLGMHWKPFSNVAVNAALWYLHMNQEFVYVGDEAVVEPSGKSRRLGVDIGFRWEIVRNLYLQADYTYSNARMTEEAKGENYIPLAPVNTFLGGISYKNKHFSAGIHTRWIGNRPANEDYSLTAKGYCITDANVAYTWKKFTVGAIAENLFNAKWREAQFATETLIPGDREPITDICFTPGTPFALRGFVTFTF